MRETICYPCELGEHDSHHEIIEAPPPGVLGGARCRCKGECVDGRYVPEQFKNIKAFVEERFDKLRPDNIVLVRGIERNNMADKGGRYDKTGTKTHTYRVINTSLYGNAEEAANIWAERGWRVVGAMTSRGSGYADRLIIERPVGVTHPDD